VRAGSIGKIGLVLGSPPPVRELSTWLTP